jgi:hypothetical protein
MFNLTSKYRLVSVRHRADLSVYGEAPLNQSIPIFGVDEFGTLGACVPLDDFVAD